MKYTIKEVRSNSLIDYCKIPMAFTGNTVFKIKKPQVFEGFILEEEAVESFSKDYDSGGSPRLLKKSALCNIFILSFK